MSILKKTAGYTMITAAGACKKKFDFDTRRGARVNEEVLKKILHLNKDTRYGQRYSFGSISSREEYKAAVPLTTYSDYRSYISKMAGGETNILTSEPVEFFGLSSGTTGKQKMIPVTNRSLRVVAENIGLLTHGIIFDALPATRRFDKGLLLLNMVTSGQTEGGIPMGAYSSGIMQSLKRIIPYLWISPPEILQLTNHQDALYLNLLFALKDKNLMYIVSLFPSAILDLFHQVEKNWPRLVEDLAGGTINKDLDLDPQFRWQLQKKLRPNPQRAGELTCEFKRGLEGIVGRIWPGMLFIGCITGGNFSIYTEELRFYISRLPIYPMLYGATEAIVGISLRPGETSYVVLPRTAYHEFIPLNDIDKQNPRTLDMDQLTVGESYEVVVTNFAGLYRYRLGDVIKVIGYYHGSPLIQFLYRRGQLINLAGEKTSEQAARNALAEAAEKWHNELVDFTTMTDYNTSPGRYIFFVEVKDAVRLAGLPNATAILEEALCRANPRYRAARRAEKVGPPELKIVRPGTFERLNGMLLTRGASVNQVKIPRVVRDAKLAQFLRDNTLAE